MFWFILFGMGGGEDIYNSNFGHGVLCVCVCARAQQAVPSLCD